LCFLIALWNTVHRSCLWATTQYQFTGPSWPHFHDLITLLVHFKFSLLEISTSAEVLIRAGIFGWAYLTG
jgi:hypothetical protein